MKVNEPSPGMILRIRRKASRIRYHLIYGGLRGKNEAPNQELTLYSPYVDNVNPEVLKLQAAVFEALGLKLQQVMFSNYGASSQERHRGHGQVIEKLIVESPTENMIFFDIDCIPLSRAVIENLYKPIIQSGALVGPIQIANHLPDRRPYAAPSALGISKTLYRRLGSPHLAPDDNVDTAGILTRKCEKKGIPVVLLPVTHCVEPVDPLYDDNKPVYGSGTTYVDAIFHSFRIAKKENERMFLDKCMSVIGGST
jgi:hypothetical protein